MIVDICCDFMNLSYASKKFDDWESALEFYCKSQTLNWAMLNSMITTCVSSSLNDCSGWAKWFSQSRLCASTKWYVYCKWWGKLCQRHTRVHFTFYFMQECSRHVDLLSSFRSLAALILINAGLLQVSRNQLPLILLIKGREEVSLFYFVVLFEFQSTKHICYSLLLGWLYRSRIHAADSKQLCLCLI